MLRKFSDQKKEQLTRDCKILSPYHNALKGNNPHMIRLIWCIARTQEMKYAYEFFFVILKGNKNVCSYKSTVTKIFMAWCFTQEVCVYLIELTWTYLLYSEFKCLHLQFVHFKCNTSCENKAVLLSTKIWNSRLYNFFMPIVCRHMQFSESLWQTRRPSRS